MNNRFFIGELYKSQYPGYFCVVLNQISQHHFDIAVWSVFEHSCRFDVGVLCASDSLDLPSSLLVSGGAVPLVFTSDNILSEQEKILFQSMVNMYMSRKNITD